MPKNSTLPRMKSSNVNVRISDELKDKVEYAKLLPGGITKIVEDALRDVEVDYDLLRKLRNVKSK